jgi:hypothetical protein
MKRPLRGSHRSGIRRQAETVHFEDRRSPGEGCAGSQPRHKRPLCSHILLTSVIDAVDGAHPAAVNLI